MDFENKRSVTMTQELLQIIRARQKLKAVEHPSRISKSSLETSRDNLTDTPQRLSKTSHEAFRDFPTETLERESEFSLGKSISKLTPRRNNSRRTETKDKQTEMSKRDMVSRESKHSYFSGTKESKQQASDIYSTLRESKSNSDKFQDYASLMVEEMSTEDYIYDLKLRKYIRDIQFYKRVFKKGLSKSNTSSEEKDRSLAEKIEDSRKSGTSLSDLKSDSRSTASKTLNDSERFDNYVKTTRSLSTQTQLSCLSQTAAHISENTILFLIPKYLLEEYSNRILDQVNEGDSFVNEINNFRRTLQRQLTEPDYDVRHDQITQVSTKDCATNTDFDRLFKRLDESDAHKQEDGFSDEYLPFIQGLFDKNKDVSAKVESRWPKGHKHHTVSEEDSNTRCLVLAEDNRIATDSFSCHKESSIILTSTTKVNDAKPFNVRQNSLFFRYKKGNSRNWQRKLRNRKDNENASKIAREKLIWRAYMDPFYSLIHDDEYYFEIWLQRLMPKCNYT